MQTLAAITNFQGLGQNNSTEPRHSRDCIEKEVVDLTDSMPITPPASQCSRLDARSSEAPTIRSQTPPPPSQQDPDLTERLADKEWDVAGILDLAEDRVQVSWAPARFERAYLFKKLYGIPLLNYVSQLDLLPNGLCDVQWVDTWEPCEALIDTFASLAKSCQTQLWIPVKIIDEQFSEETSRFLIKLRPSCHQIADHQQVKRLSHCFRTVLYPTKSCFVAVWDPIWTTPGSRVFRELHWEEHWEAVHREWTLHGRDTT